MFVQPSPAQRSKSSTTQTHKVTEHWRTRPAHFLRLVVGVCRPVRQVSPQRQRRHVLGLPERASHCDGKQREEPKRMEKRDEVGLPTEMERRLVFNLWEMTMPHLYRMGKGGKPCPNPHIRHSGARVCSHQWAAAGCTFLLSVSHTTTGSRADRQALRPGAVSTSSKHSQVNCRAAKCN